MPEFSEHACFACRKAFKKPHWYRSHNGPKEPPIYSCPECGKEMKAMGYKFRAPKKSKLKEWKQIEDGVKNETNWEVRTIRKEEKKEKKKLSPQMKKALGTIKIK